MRFQPSTFGYQAKCREAVRFLRGVAKGVLEKRQEEKNKGEDERNDILSHILKLSERDSRTTIDDMVDHFITFVVGGRLRLPTHTKLGYKPLVPWVLEQTGSIKKKQQ